jgi:hypothetical protein
MTPKTPTSVLMASGIVVSANVIAAQHALVNKSSWTRKLVGFVRLAIGRAIPNCIGSEYANLRRGRCGNPRNHDHH